MQVRSCLSTRQRSPVQGRVRVDDRPVTFGVVTVVTADGSTLTAQIRPDGTYTLPPIVQSPARPEHAGWFRIPGRYANPLRSGLGGSVAAEGSTIDLDLSAAANGK